MVVATITVVVAHKPVANASVIIVNVVVGPLRVVGIWRIIN